MIPLHFHFNYIQGTENFPWRELYTLCLVSCHVMTSATKIIVYYDKPGAGEYWDKAFSLPYVEWKIVPTTEIINGFKVSDNRVLSDYLRLKILEAEGGFHCDLNFIFIRNFEYLRHNNVVIGEQFPRTHKVNNSLIGSVPNSLFIKAYRSQYDCAWSPKEYKKIYNYRVTVPSILAPRYTVTILPRKNLYPIACSNKRFFEEGQLSLKDSYAVSLSKNLDITKEQLKKSVMAKYIRIIFEGYSSKIQLGPDIMLRFD